MRHWCVSSVQCVGPVGGALTIIIMLRGFVAEFGHIPYLQVAAKPPRWRTAYLARASCELDGCISSPGRLVFDHCHPHGYVRGVLCNGHNIQVGRIEMVMALEGVTVDLGTTVCARHLARCADCAGDTPLSPRGSFGPKIEMIRWVRQALQTRKLATSAFPVAHPRRRTAHLTTGNRRTACGWCADAMKPCGDNVPVCQRCAEAISRARGKLAAAEAALADAYQRGLLSIDLPEVTSAA